MSFCRRTKGVQWLICAERRRQVWWKSAIKVTESECCKLVLNAVFYWEPVEFFQKWCDMITLWFFKDEPCGVVLDLLYARGLFIGYSCESSIAVVNLDVIIDTTSFSVELIEVILLSARNVVRQRLLMCCFIDSVWSRCTPRYVTVVWKRMQLPPISADSQPTELIHTDEPTNISVFSVLSFSLLLCIHDKVSLIQVWMLDWAEVKSLGGALSEISVSSAYL